MTSGWPEPVERVAEFLRATGAEARIEELRIDGATAQGAAEAVGAALGQIVKTLVLVCGTESAVALVPGDRRVDPAKVAAVVGVPRARVARPAEVLEVTGYEPGAVAPFPLRHVARVLVDRTLLGEPVLWVGGGSSYHLVRIAPTELLRLTRGEPADVAEAATKVT